MSLYPSYRLKVIGNKLFASFDIEAVKKGELEGEGFKKYHKVLSDLVDVAFDYLSLVDSESQQSFKQDVKLCRASQDDIGKIKPFFFQLDHHIHERDKLSTVLTRSIDDIAADILDS